jgi:hypothetical protein
MKPNNSLNRTAPHKGGGSPSEDCKYGWCHPTGWEYPGYSGCPGYEPGYAEFPAVTCTCTCHMKRKGDL